MTLDDARKILGETIKPDGSLYNISPYTSWRVDNDYIVLDADFTVEELEAIVVWVKEHRVEDQTP